MMAKKRENERQSSSAKRNKKHKRNKQNNHLPQNRNAVLAFAEEDQQCETPVVEHEEEIICDGEVEIQMSDDAECVDVEIDEPDTQSVPSTPTPTNMTTNKKMDSSEKSKNKLNSTPPTTSKAAAATAAALNASTSSLTASTGNSSIIGKKRKGRRDSGTSSDEERWLTAIESGKLDDVDDELKKIKDPKLMTARQRAMYERNLDKEPSPGGELLMSLPTGYKEKEKPQTAEDIQKAALKSQKRKQMADEKREKDKKKTMERLLKKQETKQRSAARNKMTKTIQPMISYRNTINGATISLPPDHEFPLRAQQAREAPKPQLCGIAGCGNLKVYNCSKTKLPLCSFACYRKNVQAIKQIMC